jgi:hypothetical protein
MSINTLTTALAEKLVGYRASDGYRMDADHVARWAYQFDENVRDALLREMIHVADAAYYSEQAVKGFFKHQIKYEKFAGKDPESFWRNCNLLNIQVNGHSQREISAQFFELLKLELGIEKGDCGKRNEVFVYLDDAIFSGGRVGGDLAVWIKTKAPKSATVRILVIGTYTLGEYQLKKRLIQIAKEAEKDISFEIWAALRLENRKYHKNQSEVLWPKQIARDDAVERYLNRDHRFPFEPRSIDGKLAHPIFSGPEGRALLESEMLKAGAKIREFSQNPNEIVRPLGFGAFGLGFGSTFITYRNCPNNCPLAWWWGDPNASRNHPFSKWYPLVQRKTYGGSGFDVIDF